MYEIHICLSKEAERERGKDEYVVQRRTEQRDREETRKRKCFVRKTREGIKEK